ncbi:MAG: MBL fold metallo-hydrolase [Deltaproteobacteria bacterium]|nr:MBL fold metallo-hydrolase [Deltaproteobacteria bacterium]
MRVQFLGTGSWYPHRGRMGPCVLVEAAGARWLVDCGEGALRRLADAGVDPASVAGVLFTHTHPDHVAGLLSFLEYLRVIKHRDQMALIGPRGIRALTEVLPRLGDPDLFDVGPPLRFEEFDAPADFDAGPFRVTARPVRHRKPCVGYRIEAAGRVLTLSGDTGPCDAMVDLARGADLFVCEAGAARPYAGHMTPEEAGTIAERADARRLALVHLAPGAKAEDSVERCRKTFRGEVFAPDDLAVRDL